MLVLSKTQKGRGAFVPQQLQCGDNMYGEVQKKKTELQTHNKGASFYNADRGKGDLLSIKSER